MKTTPASTRCLYITFCLWLVGCITVAMAFEHIKFDPLAPVIFAIIGFILLNVALGNLIFGLFKKGY